MITLINNVVIRVGREWVFTARENVIKTLILCSPKIGYHFLSLITPLNWIAQSIYRATDKSLARPGRKQSTATEGFDVHISYLLSKLEEY